MIRVRTGVFSMKYAMAARFCQHRSGYSHSRLSQTVSDPDPATLRDKAGTALTHLPAKQSLGIGHRGNDPATRQTKDHTMNTKKALPILATVAALAIGSGAYVAVAQETGIDTTAVENTDREQGRRHRGERHGKGHHEHGKRGRGGHHGMHRGMMMEIFRQVDTDADGAVTRTEIDTFRAAQVAAADTTGDGALSIEEFDTLFRQFTRTRMVRAFQRIDRDGDGVITAEEMDRPMERMIRRMDRDGDGTLTLRDRRGKRG